jgi:hypothetical protein
LCVFMCVCQTWSSCRFRTNFNFIRFKILMNVKTGVITVHKAVKILSAVTDVHVVRGIDGQELRAQVGIYVDMIILCVLVLCTHVNMMFVMSL